MAPCNDNRGRFAPLKALAFAALFVPAAWFLYDFLARTLGPRPLTEIIHVSGDWALYYQLRVGVKLMHVLDANLGFDIGLSAAGIVLAITIGVVALGAARMAIAFLAQRAAPPAAPARRA